jgi:hypothetical protein
MANSTTTRRAAVAGELMGLPRLDDQASSRLAADRLAASLAMLLVTDDLDDNGVEELAHAVGTLICAWLLVNAKHFRHEPIDDFNLVVDGATGAFHRHAKQLREQRKKPRA